MVDQATNKGPIYYMVNCAHPSHFAHSLQQNHDWTRRIRGVRVNASCKSHAELDECEALDDGNPYELAQQCAQINRQFEHITVLGGCCGTDTRHIKQISLCCTNNA
jgi:S-methylmethionine-dependent homocysteine/selenocysteine methylase